MSGEREVPSPQEVQPTSLLPSLEVGPAVVGDNGAAIRLAIGGSDDPEEALVVAAFFEHFAFQLWNAGQSGGEYLTLELDLEGRALVLHADPQSVEDLEANAAELLRRYMAAQDPADDFLPYRIAHIREQVAMLTEPTDELN